MNDLRITNGVARYTSNFTVPSLPFATSSSNPTSTYSRRANDLVFGTDQYYGDTYLLLHMDGADGGTTFTDSSSANNTASNTNTEISTNQYKFGGSSAYFDGTAYLNYSSGLPLGSSNFTFETWVYVSSIGSRQYIFDTRSGGSGGLLLTVEANGTVLFSGGIVTTGAFSTTVLSTNTWYHIAAVRDTNTARLFINGVQEDTDYITGTAPGSQIKIGSKNDTTTKLTGYLDEFRCTIGIARYTSDFDVPTSSFPNNNSTNNATYSNADGLSSYYSVDDVIFDNNYLAGDSELNSFTVGMWMQADSAAADNGRNQTLFMLDGPSGDDANQFQLRIDSNAGTLQAYSTSGGLSANGTTNIADGEWHQVYASVGTQDVSYQDTIFYP